MKISVNAIHQFCPQAMYLYGTYKDDGAPTFGLFSWFGYCLDGGVRVMAAVGTGKMTSDRIKATGKFSANLVSQSMLPKADYLGHNFGYDPHKMDIALDIGKGTVLDVPTLNDSPWTYELEVEQTLNLSGSDIFICKIANILADERLFDDTLTFTQQLEIAAPAIAFGAGQYAHVTPPVGKWGDWKNIE